MNKFVSVDALELKTVKLLFNCMLHDKDRMPVLRTFNVHQDGIIETADGYRLAWVNNPDLARRLLDAIDAEGDALVKVEKVGRVVSVAPEPEQGSYPETERIYPQEVKAAAFVVDAQKLASAVSGFDFPVYIGYRDEESPIELRGKDKAGNEAYAVLPAEEPERVMYAWDPNHR